MNRQEPFVITVSREIGSGGRTVGRILAEKLNIPFYDRYLIEALEKKFNLTVEEIEKLKGEKKGWLANLIRYYSPAPSPAGFGVSPEEENGVHVTTDALYRAEKEIIQELAAENSCVIAGRSGFWLLKDHPNHLDVFITAPLTRRIRRVMLKQGLDEDSAATLVKNIDKARENYIQRYAGVSRYDARNYDLILNADDHSEEQIAGIILNYIG